MRLPMHGFSVNARKVLAELYNWFTEAFNTSRSKDTLALLDVMNTPYRIRALIRLCE
jgi:hypothetical protein